MFKYILTFIGIIFLFNSANAGNADTAIFYYKYHTTGFNRVSTLDSADFFRMILPPDGDDTLINVREFYKNGKIKFAGKSYTKSTDAFQTGVILLAGNCVNYFPDGKKQSIVHYEEGEKIGLEYSYYPMGGIYCTKKYIYQGKAFHPKALNWECYDIDGTQICDKGNGHWKLFDDEFKRIRLEGMVKNGLEDGEWRGSSAIRPGEHQSIDTIKFTYRFNKGTFVSGTGYSKSGTPYPFKQDIKGPSYLKDPIDFIRILK